MCHSDAINHVMMTYTKQLYLLNMKVEANRKNAFLAGIWTVGGLILSNKIAASLQFGTTYWMFPALLIFFFIPAFYILVGPSYMKQSSQGLKAIFMPSFWFEYKEGFVRMLMWGLGAAVIMIPYVIWFEK